MAEASVTAGGGQTQGSSTSRIRDQRPSTRRYGPGDEQACYAALDLGTNNCRLLIATAAPRGFRIVEAFSRIVRLGEGLSQTGRLAPAAMDRALGALKVCGDKIARRRAVKVRAVATQACRAADNGAEFVARVAQETGLELEVITPEEEAHLSVTGCLNLLDSTSDAALVVDVGGGSTELSWLDLRDGAGASRKNPSLSTAWLSVPIGVVTLAERFPEPSPPTGAWFGAMVEHMSAEIAAFRDADDLHPVFAAGRAHLVGTSGAITSLAGLHLGLPRYDRTRVDGLWLSRHDCAVAAQRLMRMGPLARAAEPCIGAERADLVLAGAAILQAVQSLWPCERVRVADRGLREGILLSFIAEGRQGVRRGNARGQGRGVGAAASAIPRARGSRTDG